MSSQTPARRAPRGGGRGGGRGGRRGRGSSGGGRSGGRRSQNRNNNNGANGNAAAGQQLQQQQSNNNSNSNANNSGGSSNAPGSERRDEEVLIAFMPYLKADDPRAIAIHEEYQATNDSKAFLKKTREFLAIKEQGSEPASAQDQPTVAPVAAPQPSVSAPASVSASAPIDPIASLITASRQPQGPPTPSQSIVMEPLTLGKTTPIPGTTTPIPVATGTPIPVASTPVQVQNSSHTPIQSPIRPSIGFQNRPLTTTPTSIMSAASNQSPSSFSLNHPMAFSSSSANSPTPFSSHLNNNNPPSFYLPPTLQQQNLQPPPPPTPQGVGSRPPLGFPTNPHQQGLQHGSPMQQNQQQMQQQQQQMLLQQQQQYRLQQQQQQQYRLQQQQQQQHMQPFQRQQQYQQPSPMQQQPLSMMESLELQLDRLIGGDDDLPLPTPSTPSQIPMGAVGTPRNTSVGSGASDNYDDPAVSFLSDLLSPQSNGGIVNQPGANFIQQPQQPQQQRPHMHQYPQQLSHSPVNFTGHPPAGNVMMHPTGKLVNPAPPSPVPSELTHTPKAPPSQSHSQCASQASTPAQLSPMQHPQTAPLHLTAKTPRKELIQQKRLWTHMEEQPGRVFVNDMNTSSPHVVLDVRPRQELSARWMLSWKYLQQRAEEIARKKFESADVDDDNTGMSIQQPVLHPKDDNPLNRLLPELRLGLFRRGCAENGGQASIISKSVMLSGGGGRPPYLDAQNQMVIGTVPFYSPRTPGHVVFRLYWDDEPIYTLGVGPTLHVRVTEDDYESTIRFLLSNMKKKVNPTSLSSLHSLALVLETPLQSPQQQSRARHQQQQQQQSNDRAGRATWGCICEARKVLDACAGEYAKTSQRLAKLAATVDELKADLEEEAKSKCEDDDGADEEQTTATNDTTGVDSKFDDAEEDVSRDPEAKGGGTLVEKDDERGQLLREKTRALMSGRASCERKWRDSQLAFASILKAVVTNPSMPLLLRQDMIQKMRLEYELWCPLCEEFAVPGSEGGDGANGAANDSTNEDNEAVPTIDMWYEPLKCFPQLLTIDHVRICQESRAQMQLKTLNFVPNTRTLHDLLFARASQGGKGGTTMNPGAVAILNQLSGAMGKVYQDVFTPEVEQRVNRQREMIRSQLEVLVQKCDSFPAGTKVAIFGSSANGFGTPQSDLDMCLQLPPGTSLADEEIDPSGSQAMAQLAEMMEEQSATSGIVITDVDTVRLTARIPIIMFRCPMVKEDGTEVSVECDLSMHNPLAVLNTTFLRTYADINPVTRVLAFIIKRWTKARDINNPARHTLSSYGYIIMLLHYLTYHQRAGNGLMAPVAGPEGKPLRQASQSKPLLPNLLWMDKSWPQDPPGTPYRELQSRPKVMLQHPLEKVNVNTYFYRPNSQTELAALVRLFPGQDLSLAILLTSFFRYYAYEFDYKRFVVSLHSTSSRGLVEREVKAELDGWRHYSAALTIEDPFETFYDVAHVLRGGYYHRIRREFAVAYSKIADVMMGNKHSVWTDANGEKKDPCSMTGMDLIDWICEPIVAPPIGLEGKE